MFLIVGLGNIGDKYRYTRHNIGFMLIDRVVDEIKSIKISKKEFKGELYRGDDILLLKPSTYMNLSGESVIAVKNFYKISNENIIVIHDDLDLNFKALKFKRGGGPGGHNGLKSIDKWIGSDYLRVRVGIGKPKYRDDVVNFVLNRFSEDEQKELDELIKRAIDATFALLDNPLNLVASKFSSKGVVN